MRALNSISTHSTWQPFLYGDLQSEALETVAAITQQLRSQSNPTAYSTDLALIFAYLARSDDALSLQGDELELALHYLEKSFDLAGSEALPAGLHGGLAGIGWTLQHLAGWVFDVGEDEAGDDPNAAIDEALLTHVEQKPWTGPYDLIGGLVGLGVYALARLHKPSGVTLLRTVIEQLDSLAEHSDQGITWHTPQALMSDNQAAHFPDGYYNLGVAHGVPGAIGLLSHAMVHGVGTPTVHRLLGGAVRWLLAQEIYDGAEPGFPAWVNAGAQPERTRLAWCYGDAGIAAALLSAARRVGEAAWEEAALAIARRAARRRLDDSGVRDGCICHGAAGLAHLFNRLYQATADPLLADAARFWIEQTFAMRTPDGGVGGYCFWRPDQGWLKTPGFLEGAAGLALVLLAAATPVEPSWDSLLLVDIPRRKK